MELQLPAPASIAQDVRLNAEEIGGLLLGEHAIRRIDDSCAECLNSFRDDLLDQRPEFVNVKLNLHAPPTKTAQVRTVSLFGRKVHTQAGCMLALWMFGTDLERRWGTQAFTRYYFFTGIGAGVSTILISLLPLDSVQSMYRAATVGASGAIYGLLMAWALVFPHRTILFMMLFPLPARVVVLIMGTIAFLSAMNVSGSVVNEFAHLGGLVAGWLYLKGPTNLRLDLKYRLTKWRMDRMRRRFDVHRGGRDDHWNNRVH